MLPPKRSFFNDSSNFWNFCHFPRPLDGQILAQRLLGEVSYFEMFVKLTLDGMRCSFRDFSLTENGAVQTDSHWEKERREMIDSRIAFVRYASVVNSLLRFGCYSFRRHNVSPSKHLLRICLVFGTLAALSPPLHAEITFALSGESVFDSLKFYLGMSVYADDPWGSDYGSQLTVNESSPEIDVLEIFYMKQLYNRDGITHFRYFAAAANAGVFGPPHWLPEWHILYNSGAVAEVYGTLYPDGSGRLITNTATLAIPGGNFFPNWPAAAQLGGYLILNGSPGEGNLKVANFDWVHWASPPYGRGTGTSQIFVDGVPVGTQVVDVNDNLAISFTNQSFLHKFIDYDPNAPASGLKESLVNELHWGFNELPGEVPHKPSIGIINDVIFPDAEVFTCLEGLNETYFVSSRSLFQDDSLLAVLVRTSDEEMARTVFQVINGGPGFASLRLPDAIDPMEYLITIGSQEFAWDGMDAFDFLAIDSEGVQRFSIAGPDFGDLAEMPLFSTRFAGGGPVSFTVAVPEIRSVFLAMIPMAVFLFARFRTRR